MFKYMKPCTSPLSSISIVTFFNSDNAQKFFYKPPYIKEKEKKLQRTDQNRDIYLQ